MASLEVDYGVVQLKNQIDELYLFSRSALRSGLKEAAYRADAERSKLEQQLEAQLSLIQATRGLS